MQTSKLFRNTVSIHERTRHRIFFISQQSSAFRLLILYVCFPRYRLVNPCRFKLPIRYMFDVHTVHTLSNPSMLCIYIFLVQSTVYGNSF
ncbi:hypothetical protein BDB00DRAFT_830744 [Zychaea mexicana]|uniref:uncharacterized protein n=1 Tax=Zychaea mexicana TaxID=64656 RepID=UPI0022FF008D|nr:uncharacterized protein BDB00DRAFT_830744 [Zychaea mexicana]KAI9492016.1 hypothetical protein BDB00DRAFT_830744 [Zychaea mexicana]